MGPRRWASCPGERRGSRTRRPCRTSAGTRSRDGAITRSSMESPRTRTSISSTRTPECRRASAATRRSSARQPTAGGSFPPSIAAMCSASSSTPSAVAPTASGWSRTSFAGRRRWPRVSAPSSPRPGPAVRAEATDVLRRRVIPCLDVAGGRVVKGRRFVDLVDEGDPAELAVRYAAEGADELVFLDITAAPERRGTLLDAVERTARRAFIPLTVGGGVRAVSEMRDVLRAGADKVSLNTAAVADPGLISRCAARFGRQAVVVSIDARSTSGTSDRGGPPSGYELLVTSIDRDGTQSGFDVELLRGISARVEVPVIASGGAGGPADFVAAVTEGGADAVL